MDENRIVVPHSPDKRRYDSIAILIQGDAVCGASCFDGKNILVSNNLAEKTELVTRVLAYLKKVAQKSSENIEPKEFWALINEMKAELLSYVQKNVSLFASNKTYEIRFCAALNKVTRSLRLAYQQRHHSAAFPFKMAEAVRKGSFVFLEKKTTSKKDRSLHAEMQILDYLYLHNRSVLSLKSPVYLGVSKKCCLNCEIAIRALNEVKKSKIVEVRGEGHGFSFSADIPVFLKGDIKIQNEFLRLRGVEKIETVFAVNDKGRIAGEDQLHTPSSVYESSSVSVDEESVEAKPQKNSTAKIMVRLPPVVTTQNNKKAQTQEKKPKPKVASVDSAVVLFAPKRGSPKKKVPIDKKAARKPRKIL